jgi:hypothetical protein
MDQAEKVTLAVQNNAAWCDVMLRAHGCRTSFGQHLWSSPDPAPCYYPNAITLSGSEGVEQQRVSLRQLLQQAKDPERPLAIKDSFNTLALESDGCSRLFTADWLYRPSREADAAPIQTDVHWTRPASAEALLAWEQAWGGPDHPGGLFPASLLTAPPVTVLAAYRRERVVAGCIVYRSPTALGYTNMFLPDMDRASFRAACVAAIARLSPDLPIVGYESGADLEAMRACGFETTGSLQVWLSA